MKPEQISKLPPELRKAWDFCAIETKREWQGIKWLRAALTWGLQVVEERDRLRFKLFHYSKHEGTSHTTACSIWREDGQGHAEGFEGGRGPCNCGALENFERKRAETTEATIATLTRELEKLKNDISFNTCSRVDEGKY